MGSGVDQEAVIFKGRNGALLVLINERIPFADTCEALRRKLQANRRFFASATENRVCVIGKLADDSQKQEIAKILQSGFHISKVEFAQEVEQMATDEVLDDSWEDMRHIPEALPKAQPQERPQAPAQPQERPQAPAQPQPPAHADDMVTVENILLTQPVIAETMIFNETLRSGNRVVYDGHVVVLGDINNGASVMASGNIIVLGTLRGLAHAGAFGDESAYIIAARLEAKQLRIAAQIGVSPDGGGKVARRTTTEYARLQNGTIVIEPYNGNMRNQ